MTSQQQQIADRQEQIDRREAQRVAHIRQQQQLQRMAQEEAEQRAQAEAQRRAQAEARAYYETQQQQHAQQEARARAQAAQAQAMVEAQKRQQAQALAEQQQRQRQAMIEQAQQRQAQARAQAEAEAAQAEAQHQHEMRARQAQMQQQQMQRQTQQQMQRSSTPQARPLMATAQIKGVSPRRNGGTPNLSMNGGVSPAQIADYSREASPGYMRPRQDSPRRAHQQQMQMQMQQMQRRAASPGRMPPQATQQRDPRMVPRAQMIPQAGPDARAREQLAAQSRRVARNGPWGVTNANGHARGRTAGGSLVGLRLWLETTKRVREEVGLGDDGACIRVCPCEVGCTTEA